VLPSAIAAGRVKVAASEAHIGWNSHVKDSKRFQIDRQYYCYAVLVYERTTILFCYLELSGYELVRLSTVLGNGMYEPRWGANLLS
jgi:hypothetical protein